MNQTDFFTDLVTFIEANLFKEIQINKKTNVFMQ